MLLIMLSSLLSMPSSAFKCSRQPIVIMSSRNTRSQLTRLSCLSTLDTKAMGSIPSDDPSLFATRDLYLFGNKTAFSELGVTSCLSEALIKINRPTATAIQASTFASIISGKDTVIAAETGAGKTLAFLVPLFHMLMEDDYRESIHFPSAVIMVPNKELCFQVHRMATELLDAIPEEDRKIKIATATSASGTWPYRMEESPNVLICTPSFMSKFVRGPSILEEDLFRSIRHFVLDEADMLLEGSYQRDVEKLMDAFKVTRRQMIRDGEIQVHTSILQCILSAATLPSYGMRSMEKYIERMFPLAKWISNEHLHKHHPRIVQSFHDLEGKEFLTPARMSLIIRALFNRLEEGEDTPLDFLNALEKDEDGMLQPEDSTMVFVNTAEAAVALAGALRQGGIKCAEFHKLQMANDKQEGLQQFRADEIKVLVCTDHAARGLDLPHVRHVVQAEFALNVVQHLHRIGRASRAGAMGRATNIVDERSSELVDSILSDSDTNSVDQSFSRRRGFRNKIKKAIKRSRVPVQGEGNSEESVDDFFEKL